MSREAGPRDGQQQIWLLLLRITFDRSVMQSRAATLRGTKQPIRFMLLRDDVGAAKICMESVKLLTRNCGGKEKQTILGLICLASLRFRGANAGVFNFIKTVTAWTKLHATASTWHHSNGCCVKPKCEIFFAESKLRFLKI